MADMVDRRTGHEDVEGKIFIGGLSWQTTESSLRFYFEKYGELTDVALMTDKRTGQPRGFGFITMKDSAATDIIVSTEHTIDGRVVDVKRAVPRDMAPAPSRTESKKIFVGGLPAEVTDKEFSEYFSQYGQVKEAVVMVDRATNHSRGFGFVTFEHAESVDVCIHNKNEIMGKWVEVKRAEPRDGNGRGDMGGMGMGMGRMQGGYSVGYGGRGMMPGGGSGRGMGGGGYGYGNRGPVGNDYSGAYGQYRGAPAGAVGYAGLRYPAGYGGAPGAGGRGYPQGTGGPSPYGYPQAGGMAGAGMGYGYGGPAYAAGSATGYGAAQGAYGGGSAYGGGGGPMGGPRVDGAGDAPNNYAPSGMRNDGATGYGSAAMQQAYNYGYGGGYGMYGGGVGGSPAMVGHGQPQAQAGPSGPGSPLRTGSGDMEGGANYGAIRGQGQGATQGRIDRSYRPY